MRERHVLGQLSSYLDGECAAPERVARHLEQCPECARRYAELATLSERVRHLAPPEVQPGFAAAVMGGIQRRPPATRHPWAVRVGVPAVVVTMALLVAFAAVRLVHAPTRSEQAVDHAATGDVLLNEGVLVAELERRIAASGGNGAAWAVVEEFADWPDEESTDEEWVDVLAGADWFDTVAEEVENEADLDTLLLALSDDEVQALKELLSEYEAQGWPT